jgi:hypothetical protein
MMIVWFRRILILSALILGLLVLGGWPSGGYASPLEVHRAALFVQMDDETFETRCVTFSEGSLSGYEILERSGLGVEAQVDASGTLVCKIGSQGCPVEDCWCDFPPNYWSYWQLDNGSWAYSPLGSGGSTVEDGDVDGWRWGEGGAPSEIPSYDEICTTTQEVYLPLVIR